MPAGICIRRISPPPHAERHRTGVERLSLPLYQRRRQRQRYTNRIACYSRFPILSARVLDYASSYNGSVLYELKLNEDTITLINNHLESNKLTKADKDIYEEILKAPETEKVKSGARLLLHKLAEASAIRAPQADTIAREIASSRHPSVIVCGDFNDTPISYAHRVIAQNLDDAFTQSGRGLGISYNQNKFYFRIDNILISKNLRSYNCTVDRSIRESDHYPIWCYIPNGMTVPCQDEIINKLLIIYNSELYV